MSLKKKIATGILLILGGVVLGLYIKMWLDVWPVAAAVTALAAFAWAVSEILE